MGRTPPTPPNEVVNHRELLGELRELAGRILGVVAVLESDVEWGDDEQPDP